MCCCRGSHSQCSSNTGTRYFTGFPRTYFPCDSEIVRFFFHSSIKNVLQGHGSETSLILGVLHSHVTTNLNSNCGLFFLTVHLDIIV